MKKYLFITTMLIANMALFISCVGEDDSHAEATVAFQGVLWSVDWSDKSPEDSETVKSREPVTLEEPENPAKTTDGYGYGDAIEKVYESLELIGEKSKLIESARVETNSIYAAQMLCYEQADTKIKNKISSVTFSKVKDYIFLLFKDDMVGLGYNSAEEIPLTSISSVIRYYNTSLADPLEYKLNFQN